MSSQELVTMSSEYERLLETGARWTDLTLVLNAHGTPADADLSAEHMQPNSLVFIEGYPKYEGITTPFEKQLVYLNDLRIRYGTSDERYVSFRDEIKDGIKKIGYIEPTSEVDFLPHGVELVSRLLDKDCHIQYADYKDSQDVNEYNRMFRDNEKFINAAIFPEISPNDGLSRAIKQLTESVRGEVIAHTLREKRAVATVLTTTAFLVEDGGTESLRKNSQGQLSTYLLYGTAHKNSLSGQFSSMGVHPKIIEVNPIDNHMYLDTIVNPDDYSNFARRLGQAALSSLIHRFLEVKEASELEEKSYDNLEFLNAADEEERLKFLVTCALTAREIERDPNKAYVQFLSILRSFMPSPQDYIP